MTRRSWIYLTLGVIGVGLALAWAFAPRPLAVETAAVVQGPFEASIDEEGKTRLAERYVVAAPLAGQLARITLKEGDSLVAGAPVATLTPVLSALLDERSRRELQARAEGAVANQQRAGTRVARAQVALEQAQIEQRRSEQLSQQGFVAPTKLDTDRLAVRAAQQELQAAAAERHIAEHELEQARAALGATRSGAAGAGFVLRAPVAGQVLRVLQGSEGTVAMGTPLVELGDIAQLQVVAELLTADAMAALPGSAVVIERWGGPTALQGRVLRVEPAAFTKISALGVEEQRVRVLVAITSPRTLWQGLGDGYRVSLRIITLAQERALQVPVSAVFPLAGAAPAAVPAASPAVAMAVAAAASAADGNPQHAVFVYDGGRARQVKVQVLARNAGMAWIKDGLAPGTAVVVYPPSALRDGARVAPRKG